MPYADDAAVVGPTRDKSASGKANPSPAVQLRNTGSGALSAGINGTRADELDRLLASDLVLVEDAARALKMDPKRLRGFILRNGIGDPIGSMAQVYGWSCAELAKRADAGTGSR